MNGTYILKNRLIGNKINDNFVLLFNELLFTNNTIFSLKYIATEVTRFLLTEILLLARFFMYFCTLLLLALSVE